MAVLGHPYGPNKERGIYRSLDGGKTLEVFLNVEDPGAFTTPWSAIVKYPRVTVAQIEEEVCAENNLDVLTKKQYPIPEAARPDF